MSNLTQTTMDKAKELAPWKAGLPWWVVLTEGIIVALLGVLILFDPGKSAINLALAMAAAIGIFGILQLWNVFRNKAPESIEATIATRATVGTYTGLIVLLLYFLDLLTIESGVIIFGIGGLIFGLMGLRVAIGMEGRRRRQPMLEGVFFTLVGLLMLYVYFGGGQAVETATTAIGWLSIIVGLALIGMAFMRRSQDQQLEETEEKAKAVRAAAEDAEKDANAAKAAKREADEKAAQANEELAG